ncbi:MAG: ABC transporter substrate-binding protein [Actinophytocola sp.]|nr:ABC transporter substrate-binding protein [Actinophytocola sp.]
MTSKHRLIRQPAIAVLSASGLLLTACGGGSGGGEAAGCDGTEVSVGITNSASDAPFYIGQKKGYFKEEGLTVDFVPFDSAAKMIPPMGGGDLDVGAGAPSAGFYNAVARDVNLRIVADKGSMPENYGYMPLLVRKDLYDSGEITEIADLKGRKVAEPAQATATSSTLSTMLASAGLGYNDVKHEYIGFAEHPAAFDNGAVDAALTTEPSATIAESQGAAVRLGTPPDHYDNQQLAVLLYSDSFAAEQTETAQCFMNAYIKSARDYVSAFDEGKLTGEAGDEVSEIVTEATGLEPEVFKKMTPNYIDPDGAVNMDSLAKDFEFFTKQGFLEHPVELNDIVDTSFAEKATAELGEFKPNGS